MTSSASSPALRQQVERFRREVGVEARFSADADLTLPAVVELGVFRVVQEALLNVQKHARASHVYVRLECDGDDLVVHVDDDGLGIEVANHRDLNGLGTGLRSMRGRAELLGGALQVESRRGGSTAVLSRLADTAGRRQAVVTIGDGTA